MKKWFLPVGIVFAALSALTCPQPGILLRQYHIIPVAVITIFLVNGVHLNLGILTARKLKELILPFSLGSLISLLLGPLLGKVVGDFTLGDSAAKWGLVIMATMPVTLSSASVIARVGGGDDTVAMMFSILMNLCSIISVPLVLPYVLSSPANSIEVDSLRLFLKLFLLVLLPLVVGYRFRRYADGGDWLKYVPSGCVILSVYSVFSANVQSLQTMTVLSIFGLFIPAFLVHLCLLGIAFVMAGWVLKLSPRLFRTYCFVFSQKTLPLAIGVIASLRIVEPEPLLVCILFHFGQLLFDSVLAVYWQKNQPLLATEA